MIVLDENLDEQRVRVALAARYQGKTISVRELRPGTVIKDDAVPTLLREENSPTFITTNVIDFWRKVAAHHRYCIVCLPLPNERQDEIPDLTLRKVIWASGSDLRYYVAGERMATKVPW